MNDFACLTIWVFTWLFLGGSIAAITIYFVWDIKNYLKKSGLW